MDKDYESFFIERINDFFKQNKYRSDNHDSIVTGIKDEGLFKGCSTPDCEYDCCNGEYHKCKVTIDFECLLEWPDSSDKKVWEDQVDYFKDLFQDKVSCLPQLQATQDEVKTLREEVKALETCLKTILQRGE